MNLMISGCESRRAAHYGQEVVVSTYSDYRVEWDRSATTVGSVGESKVEYFDTEAAARKFARSLRSDGWHSVGGVFVYRCEGNRLLASNCGLNDSGPL